MKYELNNNKDQKVKGAAMRSIKNILSMMADEKSRVILAVVAMLANSGLNLVAPLIVGFTIDKYVQAGDYHGVLFYSAILLVIYITAFIINYIQMRTMGGVAQRVLFRLRNIIFEKLQSLPIAFFNQNKVGDLISRINSDTDKLNQFFSETLMRFFGSIFIMIGAGIFIVVINPKLGGATLLPALGILIFTRLISGWTKAKNKQGLQATGAMSAEIQESLSNFKVIVAFNRRDYFREKFAKANLANFKASLLSGLANNIYNPIYGFFSNLAQIIVLGYGVYLISQGSLTVGVLIGFLVYIDKFYNPLREIASLWYSLQTALAAWDRISEILNFQSDLEIVSAGDTKHSNALIEFENVHFRYSEDKEILHGITLSLMKGKTYAFVGPTGGGKTTTASLLARLYDPSEGTIYLEGKDIRSYSPKERTEKIGFILQDPFLFSGNVKDNILYGNEQFAKLSDEDFKKVLDDAHLTHLMLRFDQGLETKVTSGNDISVGQRQLIAFIRAVLRKPALLILDEASANIDTVTEKLLQDILDQLPKETTKVIIAHRLNTIENADEIFFVNSGDVVAAGSFENAVKLLMHGDRQS